MTPSSFATPRRDVFDSLRAEREGEWLHDVFVQPHFLTQIGGERPVVVVGGHGAGKTSARLWLTRTAAASPGRLVVDWVLSPASLTEQGEQGLSQLQDDLLRTCIRSLVRHFTQNPTSYFGSPSWLRDNLRWLAGRYTAGWKDLYFRQLQRGLMPDQAHVLNQILQSSEDESDMLDATLSDALNEFTAIVTEVGLIGIWVMVDGLESWLDATLALLSRQIEVLLSTLLLFETPGFAIKLFAPDELENSLLASGGVTRRRLEVVRMRWNDDELRCHAQRSGGWPRSLAPIHSH